MYLWSCACPHASHTSSKGFCMQPAGSYDSGSYPPCEYPAFWDVFQSCQPYGSGSNSSGYGRIDPHALHPGNPGALDARRTGSTGWRPARIGQWIKINLYLWRCDFNSNTRTIYSPLLTERGVFVWRNIYHQGFM